MPLGKKKPTFARPLLTRPGARFTCFSDGVCCSDIHALGPLTPSEVRAARALVPDSVSFDTRVDTLCMRPGSEGMCAQREEGLCGLHKRFGAEAKPGGCRRFPYGLLTTPEGGRITTEHRCPCRTMGERPPLDVADAERSLLGANGRLEADHRVPSRIPVAAGRWLSFERYRSMERVLIHRLLAGERAEEVLAATPLPPLQDRSWPALIAEFYEMRNDTAGGMALCWFADALLHLSEGHSPPERPRPWSPGFDRARARTPRPEQPDRIINDWVADELWMMRWLDWDCTFDVACAELVTRVQAVRTLIGWLRQRRVRADQAAAEAIMIAEIGTCNEHWTDIVELMANHPSPRQTLPEPSPAHPLDGPTAANRGRRSA